MRTSAAQEAARPNPCYSGTLLLYGLITSFIVDGNGYLLKVRDQLDRIAELWWVPHFMLEPRWPADGSAYISHYDYRPRASCCRSRRATSITSATASTPPTRARAARRTAAASRGPRSRR